jgi:hypothetical protein
MLVKTTKEGREELLDVLLGIIEHLKTNAKLAHEPELAQRLEPLGKALSLVFQDADTCGEAEDRLAEATRWCKLWAAGKGNDSARQILDILKKQPACSLSS